MTTTRVDRAAIINRRLRRSSLYHSNYDRRRSSATYFYRLHSVLTTLLPVLFLFVATVGITNAPSAQGYSPVKSLLLNWFKNSDLVADLHAEHVASPIVRHMMKGTPLVNASDTAKMDFASGPGGCLVSFLMASEQELLGDWKVGKIVEAAEGGGDGCFDSEAGHRALVEAVGRTPVTLFSFVDCPWCLLAKRMLREEYGLGDGCEGGSEGVLRVVELEDIGREGKEIRASIALATGRTSMPACFVDGLSIGGFTDGFYAPTGGSGVQGSDAESFSPDGSRDLRMKGAGGLRPMHETGELRKLIEASIDRRNNVLKES